MNKFAYQDSVQWLIILLEREEKVVYPQVTVVQYAESVISCLLEDFFRLLNDVELLKMGNELDQFWGVADRFQSFLEASHEEEIHRRFFIVKGGREMELHNFGVFRVKYRSRRVKFSQLFKH